MFMFKCLPRIQRCIDSITRICYIKTKIGEELNNIKVMVFGELNFDRHCTSFLIGCICTVGWLLKLHECTAKKNVFLFRQLNGKLRYFSCWRFGYFWIELELKTCQKCVTQKSKRTKSLEYIYIENKA